MATYCQAGDRAKLLVNGSIVGTYAAPLSIEIVNNSVPFPSWMDEATKAATQVLPPGIYTVTIQPLCGGNPTVKTYSVRAIFKPPVQFSTTCPNGSTPSYYSSTEIVALYPSGSVSLWQVINSSIRPNTTFVKTGENGFQAGYILSVTDGKGESVHNAAYESDPEIEVYCLESLTKDEWSEKYQTENCDDLRECLECVNLALSQLPF